LEAASANERETAARMRAAGATRQQVAAVDAQARAYARAATETRLATDKEVGSLRNQAVALDASAKKLEKDVQDHQRLSRTLNEVSSAVTMVGLAMVGLGAIGTAALFSMVKGAIEYDRQVALTKTQTDGFKATLADLGQMGKDVGKSIAVPFEELQSALYDIFSSTNANMAQAKVLLVAFAKAAVAGQVSIEDAGRSTMGIMNAFKIPIKQVNTVLDKQFQLVRKGVGTYGQFASVIGKLTPSAVRLGQNLDTMDATLIFLTRNGLSAASSVASAARAFDALANPKTVGKLEKLGIKVRDVKGQFLPLVEILKGMSTYLMKLPSAKRAGALFDIFKSSGGTIQAKRFFDLVLPTAKGAGNLGQFEQFLKDMKNSTGQFGQAYGTMANTVAAKSQLLKNNWNIMKVTIGQALEPAFKRLLDVGSKIIGWFNKLTPQQQQNLAKWALMATVITTVVGVVVLIVGGIGALAAALAALGLSLGAVIAVSVGVVAAFVAIGGALYAAYKGSQPVRQLFNDIGKTFSDIWNNDIQPFIQGIKAGFDRDLLPAFRKLSDVVNKDVVPVLDDLWNRIGKKLVKVLREAGNILKDLADVGFKVVSFVITKFLIPAIKQATDYYDKHKKAIDNVIKVIMQVIKWVLILVGGTALGMLIVAIAAAIAIIAGLIKVTLLIIHFFTDLWAAIKLTYNWMNNFGASVNNAADSFGRAIKGGFNAAVNWFRNLPNKITNAIGRLDSVLWNAGIQVIDGLINGIKSKMASLGNFLGGVGSFITSHKGPPEKDIKMLHNAGRLIMKGLQNGIASSVPSLNKQLKGLTSKMQATVNGSVSAAPVASSTKRKPSGDRHVVVNVYTQEIRPEYHSQQLGQLIAGTL
jgi:TP901 family phage tail tape measure protein